MKKRCILAAVFATHWASFWALNGLDKFLNGREVAGLVWTGKNRLDQFDAYLVAVGIEDGPVVELLTVVAVTELVIALPFLWSVLRLLSRRRGRFLSGLRALELGLAGSLLLLMAFSAVDVVVGDRAELLEHGTYLIAVGVTYLVARFEEISSDVLHHIRVATEGQVDERPGGDRPGGDRLDRRGVEDEPTMELAVRDNVPAWAR